MMKPSKTASIRARRDFRSVLLTAHDAGANKAELARALGVSRQRVDEVLTRARHERAAGVEDVTDESGRAAGSTDPPPLPPSGERLPC